MPERKPLPPYPDPMSALRNATHIGPPQMKEGMMLTPKEEQDPMRQIINLLGLEDPLGQGTVGGPIPAVAMGGPGNIPALKAGGKALIDKLGAQGGVARRSLGYAMKEIDPLKPEVLDALKFAQQKYPRIFGHLEDIHGVDAMTILQNLPNTVHGALYAAQPAPPAFAASKASSLGISPNYGNPETVGHELLHGVDRILNPSGFSNKYAELNKLHGYENNPMEVRARAAGDSFKKKFQASKLPPPPPQEPSVADKIINMVANILGK